MTGQTSELHTWWADLRHGGLLISPVVLNEWLPEGPPTLDDRRYRRLRDRFTAFQAKTTGDGQGGPAVHDWIDALLEEFLRHPKERWRKGADIPEKVTGTTVTGQRLRPHRVLLDEAGTLPKHTTDSGAVATVAGSTGPEPIRIACVTASTSSATVF